MNFTEFQQNLVAKIRPCIPDDADISIQTIPKNNGVNREALVIVMPGETISPTIYLDEQFERFQSGIDLDEISKDVLELHDHATSSFRLPSNFFQCYEDVQSDIRIRLIHREQNKKLLTEVPHRDFLDLSVVFYYSMPNHILRHATVLIKNRELQAWNITVEQLYEDAFINTKREDPWTCKSLRSVVYGVLQEVDIEKAEPGEDQYILTTQSGRYGAVCMLYGSLLKSLADSLRCDLILIPSSIHELIVMPRTGVEDMEEISSMIREINHTQVAKEEVLSDHPYLYDRVTGEVSMGTTRVFSGIL